MVNSQVMAPADDEMREDITASNRNADIHQPENPRKKKKIVLPETASSALMNLPSYCQHLAKGKIFSVVRELEGQALFGSPATTHTSHDSWTNRRNLTHSAADGHFVPSYGNC